MVSNSAPLSGGRAILQTVKGCWRKGGKTDTLANEFREPPVSQEVNGTKYGETVEECEPPSGFGTSSGWTLDVEEGLKGLGIVSKVQNLKAESAF